MRAMYGIGIDIGGTKISIVLGNDRGRILEREVFPTPHGKDVPRVFSTIKKVITRLLQKRRLSIHQIKGVGVGTPGLFNEKKGVVEESPNLKDWVGLPLRKNLQTVLRRPVRIENDANATVIAEKHFGLGKGLKTFIYITVSTGIGSGIIINNKLHRGVSGSAGEVGHSIVDPCGWKNHLSIRGTLEGESSGTAIARKAKERLKRERTSLSELRTITARDVKRAAVKGDRLAKRILQEAGEYLGIGLANLIMILNPERIILGGGVLKDPGGDLIFRAMKDSLKRHTWHTPFRNCSVVKSKLLKDIADLGALSLVFEK